MSIGKLNTLLLVMVGGAFGALSRYLMSTAIHQRLGIALPYGTLFVNVLGCFLLGFLGHYAFPSGQIAERMRLAVGVGFLGGMTTFSTFAFETVIRLEEGQPIVALVNLLANVTLGMAAVWLGASLSR